MGTPMGTTTTATATSSTSMIHLIGTITPVGFGHGMAIAVTPKTTMMMMILITGGTTHGTGGPVTTTSSNCSLMAMESASMAYTTCTVQLTGRTQKDIMTHLYG